RSLLTRLAANGGLRAGGRPVTKWTFRQRSLPCIIAPVAYHLAQYNLAWLNAPLDDRRIADFKHGIDEINRLADEAPGFVGRHQTVEGDSPSIPGRNEQRSLHNIRTSV